jgi:aryl-phospho-beta-D-glucosidase BglC (GH1 family)
MKVAGVGAVAMSAGGEAVGAVVKTGPAQSVIPRWRGFNLLDYFSPRVRRRGGRGSTTEDDFRWMADWGFDFVRLPMAYPRWLTFDASKPITPEDVYNINEQVLEEIDELVEMAHKYKLHVSLNMHRAPGYCVNAGFNEPYNLWEDQEAQDAFCFHWAMWAKRYKGMSQKQISFDLVNEPGTREDMNDQHSKRGSVPGAVYRKVAKAASEAIRAANPDHLVVADGNDTGSSVIPEIADLNIAQSCRGYVPGSISHYKAPWAVKDPDSQPEPHYPGISGGEHWDRARLEEWYKPWFDLARQGVGVHCGECGCWTKTPHDVFMAWFTDVIDILTKENIGYSLWNFRGDFGILDSNRDDVDYEDWHGHKLDRKLLTMLLEH